MKDAAEQIAMNPKVSTTFSAALTSFFVWALDVLPEVLSIITSVVGIVIGLVILRYHIVNTRKTNLEIKKLELENEDLEDRAI